MDDRMEIEFRPDDTSTGSILDEIVIQGASTIHAEMMGDASLWIGVNNAAGHLVHINIWAERKGGKLFLRMRGEDQGVGPTNEIGPAQPKLNEATCSTNAGRAVST